ncbi:MAG: TIGR00282 family metallophosphoesterase [Candidatus Omnitrophica bacterium]|nr:TIGR00282 family metallophosphoesterase [Candidatus Omnitrophota bacterium]
MKILFIGDIVGKPGRETIAGLLPGLKTEFKIDVVIANAENAAGGSGITVAVADELFSQGIDVLTSGDHIFKRRESFSVIDHPRILRPANLPENVPGKGLIVITVKNEKIAVINLEGRVFMNPIDCPFRVVRSLLTGIDPKVKIIIVDMHAEATSEKIALGWFLDGKVSAVLGTHTHVQTADENILPAKTAYISDVGMTGSCASVIGRNKEQIIERFLSSIPTRFELARGDEQLQGVLVDIDEKSGQARKIKRIKRKASA